MQNLLEISLKCKKAKAISKKLVAAFSKACSKSEGIWREARKTDDFNSVKPYLKEVLNLTIQMGQAKADVFDLSLYDALLDDYERGAKSIEIDQIFNIYEKFLPSFLEQVVEKQKKNPKLIFPTGPFPIDVQKQLGMKLMASLGFDFNHGRLDVSPHPFCGGIPEDVRITTRSSGTGKNRN